MFASRSRLLSLLALLWCCTPAFAQLRGHWRLQETSGTTAVDTSPLSNNGTYTNSPALASSTAVPSDSAISAMFDGSNDYVAIPNESNYDLTGAMTVCCWIKVDSFNQPQQAIVTKGNNSWRLTREGNTNYVQFACNGLNSNNSVVSVTNVNDGQWHHVAGVYTGSQLRIYIDGELDNSENATGSISTNNHPVEIARNSQTGNRQFDGAIYNVVVYNGALDEASIQMLANWDALSGNWKLNQTSGTTATDSILLANHGTYTNSPLLAASGPYPGAGDKAANFDGTNDYVATSNEHYYDFSGPISVAAWVCVDTFTKQWQAIVTKGDSAWRLTRNDNGDTLRFTCTGLSTTSVSSNTSVNDGAWHHVVGVYTGSQLQIYVDGVLDNSVAATGVIARNSQNLQIARNAEVSGKEFDGRIHDVRVYSVALSANKVAELYGLIGNWKLNQASGTTANDSSVFAANGTVSGAANWATDCGGTSVFDFNGTNNYVTVANASHLQPTSALTVCAWVKGDAWGSGSDCDTIVRKGTDSPTNFQFDISDSRVELVLDGNDSAGTRGNTVLATGQWYHVAAVWDGATVRIFVNGVLDNSPPARTGAIGVDTRSLYLGGRSGADLFDGMIRDVRIFNRALYDAEVRAMAGVSGLWAFSEGAGSLAADSSGLANNATLTGGATWTSDCSGGNHALLTNGSGGVARTNAPFTPPETGTVAFWMRSTGAPASVTRILGCGADWEVRQNPDGRVISDLCGDGATTIGSVTPLTDVNRWYHFAATFDSTNDTFATYVDGKLEMSGTNPVAMSQQPADYLSFGTRTGSAEYWNGALRDMRIYNRKLCPAEITALYGLMGHWKLDDSSGAVASDSSGLGRNMTVVGTPAWSTGSLEGAIQLNGATRAEVSHLMGIGSPSNVTIAGWANLTGKDSSGAELISIGDYFAIRLDEGSSTRCFFYNGSSWSGPGVSQSFLNAGWHHFAAVFNDTANTCKLYIDGVEVASMNTTVTIPFTGLGTKTVIGMHGNGGNAWDFTGKIDDVRVYSRALCPAEIQTLADDGGHGFGGVKIIKWVEIQ